MFGITSAGASEQPQPADATKDNISSAPAETTELLLPMISEEMSKLASALTEKFQGTTSFASAEVPAERDRVIVHWHGGKTPELQKILEEHGSVPVELRQTRFRPGLLQEQAASLARSAPAVKSYEIAHDASSISITVSGQTNERAAAAESARGIERRTNIPVRISDFTPTAANSRPFDTGYHIGGSKLYNPANGGGCSSGFAVRQTGTNKQGIMFAAHCGGLGTQWAVYDGGAYYYLWGSTVARNTTFDGAIIDTEWSQEYVWNGDYQTTGIAPIRGYAAQFVGQEICYSGGYSGTKCGNILQSANITYNLGGDLTHVNGFRTEQINGEPAAGNGDSGGPGYTFVTDSGGYSKRVAVGIISAIPQNSGTNCQGVPGSSALGGRKCSSTVYSTPVSGISNATGWYVPTYP
jgi:hypothetical protein